MERRGTREGFTLIEMAVVLVIIGLVVGGVLVGRDLIKTSVVRAEISQLEKYATAAVTFRTKYNCLPGDCENAVSLGLGSPGGPGRNGNGDGMIAGGNGSGCFEVSLGTSSIGSLASESLNFWYHLSQALLLQEGAASGTFVGYTGQSDFGNVNVPQTTTPELGGLSGTTIIPTAFQCGAVSGQNSQGNGFWVGGVPPHAISGSGNNYIGPTIPPTIVKQIDLKIDDGLPLTGNVLGDQGGTRPSVCRVGASCGYCNIPSTSTNTYNPSDSSAYQCRVVFINRF